MMDPEFQPLITIIAQYKRCAIYILSVILDDLHDVCRAQAVDITAACKVL
jgi:hypothetical protein